MNAQKVSRFITNNNNNSVAWWSKLFLLFISNIFQIHFSSRPQKPTMPVIISNRAIAASRQYWQKKIVKTAKTKLLKHKQKPLLAFNIHSKILATICIGVRFNF